MTDALRISDDHLWCPSTPADIRRRFRGGSSRATRTALAIAAVIWPRMGPTSILPTDLLHQCTAIVSVMRLSGSEIANDRNHPAWKRPDGEPLPFLTHIVVGDKRPALCAGHDTLTGFHRS